MIGHISHCRLITYTLIMDFQFIFFCKFIFHRDIKFSRKTIFSVRADTVKYNAVFILRNLSYFPKLLLKSIRTAVKIVVIFILCKLYLFVSKHKPCACNTVTASANHCSEKASIHLIRFQVIISQNYICQFSFSVRHTQLHQKSPKLCYFHKCSGSILQMIDLNCFSCGQYTKFSLAYTHCLQPPIIIYNHEKPFHLLFY